MRGLQTIAIAVVSAACLAGAQTASAGRTIGFSSDTGAGSATSFDWDGGDAGAFGTPGTLFAAMRYAADTGAGTNFDGVAFKNRKVNMFLVDFSTDGSNTYTEAGLTLFVMWGKEGFVGSFAGEVDVSPLISEGTDGSFTPGLSEIYGLGAGVTVDTSGPVAVDVDVINTSTPVGYAITNIDSYPGGITNKQFTLGGEIVKLGLYAPEGKVWEGVDDDGAGTIFTDGITFSVIPAPPAALWGLAGLAGMAVVARRRSAKA